MSKKNEIFNHAGFEKYYRLFETAQDGILILSYPDGLILDANPFILNLLDCEKSAIVNKKLWQLGFIEDKHQALKLFQELIDKGYIRYENLALRKSSGELLPVEFICNSYPVGNQIVIQCNIRDISERIEILELQEKIITNRLKNLNDMVACLSLIIESRDPYTVGHQMRVTDLVVRIANYLKLPKSQILGLEFAAMLHDIGKFKIPLELLVKPTALSDEEWNLIKMHPIYGANLLKSIQFDQDVPRFVLEHHERLNGSGYPYGLKENQISLEAKIIAVADVMEAMTSFRPYRPALEFKHALKELYSNQGKLYDKQVVDACMHIIINEDYQFPSVPIIEKKSPYIKGP